MRVLLTLLGRRFGLARRPLAQNDAGGALGEGKRRRAELATGQGGLTILEVQPAGKKKMPVAEFLRGRKVRPGDVFGDPAL